MTPDEIRRIVREEISAVVQDATWLESDSLVLTPLYALSSAADRLNNNPQEPCS